MKNSYPRKIIWFIFSVPRVFKLFFLKMFGTEGKGERESKNNIVLWKL